jgi:hypothetical protein
MGQREAVNIARRIESAGGRRFVLTVGCGSICTILVWFGRIDGPVFRDIIIGTVAAYIAGNVAQKLKGQNDSLESTQEPRL